MLIPDGCTGRITTNPTGDFDGDEYDQELVHDWPCPVHVPATQPAGRQEVTDLRVGLDQLEAWMDLHPEIPLQRVGATWVVSDLRLPEGFDPALVVRAVKDGAAIGAVSKIESPAVENVLFIERRFHGGVKLSYQAQRDQICERVVTGVEVVEVPDPDAPLVKVEREVVEWRCAPILIEQGSAA